MSLFEIKTVKFFVQEDGSISLDERTPTWIEVKATLPYNDLRRYYRKQFEYVDISDLSRPKIKPNYMDADKFLLKLAIVNWSEEAEVNDENIDKLPGNLVTALVDELKRMYGITQTEEVNEVIGE